MTNNHNASDFAATACHTSQTSFISVLNKTFPSQGSNLSNRRLCRRLRSHVKSCFAVQDLPMPLSWLVSMSCLHLECLPWKETPRLARCLSDWEADREGQRGMDCALSGCEVDAQLRIFQLQGTPSDTNWPEGAWPKLRRRCGVSTAHRDSGFDEWVGLSLLR